MKFTTEDLLQLIQGEKLSQKEAAARLGVSEAAVSQRLKRVGVAVNRHVAMFAAGEAVARQLTTAEQLEAIGGQVRALLGMIDLVLNGDQAAPEVAEARGKLRRLAGPGRDMSKFLIELLGELRKQLEFDFNMRKEVYSLRQVEDFQRIVMEEIKAADPEVAQRISRRLVEVQATRSSLDLGVSPAAPGAGVGR